MESTGPPPLRHRLEFIVLSFEGPDLYSMVGGLGVRVTEMTRVLAEMGFVTRLFFVGDPAAESVETHCDGRLHLHRWSRWVAKQYGKNVYEGEQAKVEDYQNSLPRFLLEKVISPNAARGVTTVVLGEDWQTARTVSRTAEMVQSQGLLRRCLFLWNANNTFGFEGLDWGALTVHTQLLTVSRYMREKMRGRGLLPLVVQNGIPPRYWESVDEKTGKALRKMFPDLLLAKVGRYHPDKRWLMAVEAVGECKRLGLKPKLLLRGGSEEYGQQVRDKAAEQGLSWAAVRPESTRSNAILQAIAQHQGADVLELDFFVPEKFLRSLYWASNATLANSGHEPFGLVGLEVMACGGVALTGSTGEEYVQSFHNGIALGSDDPREITVYLRELLGHPALDKSLREHGRTTSHLFAWQIVLKDLLRKIEFLAWVRGVDLT
jgi:glycosyltransferase involved in cell wall biosynthesis